VTTLLIVAGMSLALSTVLTPVARIYATRLGLVDNPDGRRKMHKRPIPVAGGCVILLATSAGLLTVLLAPNHLQPQLLALRTELAWLLAAAFLICTLGVADDTFGLRGRHKIVGQLIAIALVIQSGVLVQDVQIFDWHIELGLLAVPFTIFWLLGAINSLNLIDGMDGLLSTIALIICLAMGVMAIQGEHWLAASLALALAGALAGFLIYNLPPATIFLGDSGSMLIGLVVGILGIKCSLKGPATISLAAPLAVLTIPIFDTLAAILRRKLTGRSIYATDRGHLHHCLLRHGFSSRAVLVLVACLCLLGVAGALASLALKSESVALISAGVVVSILVVSRLFGYAEFLLVKHRLLSLVLSFVGKATQAEAAYQTEVHLQGSADWTDMWNRITECASDLNLVTVHLDLNAPAIHEGYNARWRRLDRTEEDNGWDAAFPLTAVGHSVGRLEVEGIRDEQPIWQKIATLMELVEELEVVIHKLAVTTAPKPLPTNGALKEPLRILSEEWAGGSSV
jgi:UDP-GlcNAc:undecaprenyl-phosphate GlcNAc-1-phosphate transferase